MMVQNAIVIFMTFSSCIISPNYRKLSYKIQMLNVCYVSFPLSITNKCSDTNVERTLEELSQTSHVFSAVVQKSSFCNEDTLDVAS